MVCRQGSWRRARKEHWYHVYTPSYSLEPHWVGSFSCFVAGEFRSPGEFVELWPPSLSCTRALSLPFFLAPNRAVRCLSCSHVPARILHSRLDGMLCSGIISGDILNPSQPGNQPSSQPAYAIQVQSINLVPGSPEQLIWLSPWAPANSIQSGIFRGSRFLISSLSARWATWVVCFEEGSRSLVGIVDVEFGSRQNLNECWLSCVLVFIEPEQSNNNNNTIPRPKLNDRPSRRLVVVSVCTHTKSEPTQAHNQIANMRHWKIEWR